MVQGVAATTQRAEQVPVGKLKLGAGPVLPGTEAALIGGGGGAEVWLDGEQMGIVCRTKTYSGSGNGDGPVWWPLNGGPGQECWGQGHPTCFAGLDADGLEA